MKKCPKCGTVLDDSKKTCYMCGTVLTNNSPLNFGETFDSQIGATVTKSQDNVFNNVKEINNNDFQSIQSSGTANMFKDQFNSLNSQRYDERTALEKIFSDDSRFKSKDELNAMSNQPPSIPNKNEKGKGVNTVPNPMANTQFSQPAPAQNSLIKNSLIQNNPAQNTPVPKKPAPKPTKPKFPTPPQSNNSQINWGDNLKDTNKKIKFNLSLTFIFNLVSFVLFVAVMLFVYFNYFKPKKEARIEFGGIVYSINDEFILKKDDNFSRYYTKGEQCTISITYGTTNDVDGFVEKYFDEVRQTYETAEGYTTSTEELKIDGNTWQELNVIKLQENPSGTGGFSTNTMFKYIAMIYKGTYYDIRYANLDGDGTCSANYDSFIESISFQKEK